MVTTVYKEQKIKIIDQLKRGVLLEIKDSNLTPDSYRKYTVADMITGYGVSEAAKYFYQIHNEILKAKESSYKDGEWDLQQPSIKLL